MLNCIGKWKDAKRIAYFMHISSIEKNIHIKEDACHAIVKAYGWKNAQKTLQFSQMHNGTLEALRLATVAIAQHVYSQHKGREYIQKAAGTILTVMNAHPPHLNLIDSKNPAQQRHTKEFTPQEEMSLQLGNRDS